MTGLRKIAVIVSAMLILLSGTLLSVSSIHTSATAPHYLGFWLQEGNIVGYMSPSSFVQQYFGTPPYPSGLEMMTTGPTNYFRLKTTSTAQYTLQSAQFWSQVASYTNANYPGVKIQMMVGLCHNEPQYTCQPSDYYVGLNLLQTWLNTFGHHPSVYSVGLESEYTDQMYKNVTGLTAIMNIVHNAGYQFVSYGAYLDPTQMPSGGYIIGHTGFPGGDAGCLGASSCDQEQTLTNLFTDSPYVGIFSGYYAQFSYPASIPTCPVNSTSSYNGSGYGWNQCVVDTEISSALSLPLQYREFVNLCPGFANTQTNANQLWMDPTLRNWIWTDPQYQSNFNLSTDIQPGSTSSSFSTSTSSHTSSSSSFQTFSSSYQTSSTSDTTYFSSSSQTLFSSSTLSSSSSSIGPGPYYAADLIVIVLVVAVCTFGFVFYVRPRLRERRLW